jgi:mannan endo-1,4-beta-mannosidase
MNAKKLRRFSIILAVSSILMIAFCARHRPTGDEEKRPITNSLLVDSLATPETVALFRNLQNISRTGVLFGHQDDTAYGVDWKAEPGRSDVKEVCGDYPAVYGWDLGDIQNSANLDGVDFALMKNLIRQAYARGGINTISMHLDNPVSGGDAWDNSAAVGEILPGKPHHAEYLHTLSLIAAFLKDLKTPSGTFIPVILRPYHEHNQTWSWWSKASCTAGEYNALWRMTVEYFRDESGLHHLLYAISPQDISTESEYLERYPGDDVVDILGLDYYRLTGASVIPQLGKTLQIIRTLAENRGKISAVTEIGVDKVSISDWWTGYLLKALKYSEQSQKTAWTLVWRNASKSHHFGPYPGHVSAPDFEKFHDDSLTVFEGGLPEMYR